MGFFKRDMHYTFLYRILVSVLVCSCGLRTAYASHVFGSEIAYTYLDSGLYQVRLVLIRDCNGIYLNQLKLTYHSNGQSIDHPLIDSIHKVSVKDITGIPTFCPTKSRCYGSYQYGFEEHINIDTIDLSAFSNCDWEISWQQCCRAGMVTTGQSGEYSYNFAFLNKCLKNSSPIFSSTAQVLLCQNQNTQISFAVGPNNEAGDSFSYHLASALTDSASPCSYIGPYTPLRPLTFFGFPNYNLALPAGFHLDPVSGLLAFKPTRFNEVATICVEVKEWRKINGTKQLIGIVRRDIMVVIIACPNNTPPFIDSTNAGGGISGSGSEYHEICIKDTFCLNIQSSDPGIGSDSIFIFMTVL